MNTTDTPNVPLPAGNPATDGWTSIDHDGALTRSLEWSSHDTANVGLSVDGWQRASGEYTCGVSLYGVSEGKQIDAAEARQLAAALLNAADELDKLTQGGALQ